MAGFLVGTEETAIGRGPFSVWSREKVHLSFSAGRWLNSLPFSILRTSLNFFPKKNFLENKKTIFWKYFEILVLFLNFRKTKKFINIIFVCIKITFSANWATKFAEIKKKIQQKKERKMMAEVSSFASSFAGVRYGSATIKADTTIILGVFFFHRRFP